MIRSNPSTLEIFLFFLPPYSPHLNIIERFWKELKEGWVRPGNYLSVEHLLNVVHRIFAAVGDVYKLQVSDYSFKV